MPGPGWVRLAVQPQYSDAVEKLADRWGWYVHREIGGMYVRTKESYPKKPPMLLVPERIADERDAASPAIWKVVQGWCPQGNDLGLTQTQIAAEIERHRSADTIAGWWHAIELSLFTARDAELADLLRVVMTRDVLPKYPFASLWHVNISPVLDARMSALRTLLAEQEAPEVIGRKQFTGFEAGKALMNSSSLGFEAYVEPALMALAPFLLGMAVPRMGGPIVFLFGTPQPGLSRQPGHDLLELYRAPVMSSAARLPGQPRTISTWAMEAFFKWWIERLNLLFGQLLDPVEFASPDGTYDVARHLAAVLSVERVFLCLHHLLTSGGRDEFVRQLLLFHVVDMLEGLGLGRFEQLLTAGDVERRIARLKAELHPDVAAIALPKCEHALEALKQAANEFYLKERIRDDKIRLKRDDGHAEEVAVDRALARYLQLIRNSTHSFRDKMTSPRHRSLFVAHTGILHDTLPDLAFLHVLHMLLDAGSLRF